MRAVIYRRVSTGKQVTQGASLDQQREACLDYAARQGWTIVGDYPEMGRSAYVDDVRRRPVFARLLSDAQARRFDVVLVYELSRFARRQRVQFSAAGDLESHGVRVVSVTEPMDLDTIGGFVTYSVLAMQAELHSRILSRKLKDTRERERSQGRSVQTPPRGMSWCEGRLVWSEPELPRRAFELAATGVGTPSVHAALIAEGHHISLSSLHYVLRNPAYIGMIRHAGGLVAAEWEPLVDRAVWNEVQRFRAARHPANAVRATVRSRANAELAGILFCANCGAKMHYNHHGGGPGRRNYYDCSCQSENGHCNARPSRADTLHDAIGAIVGGLAFPAAVVQRARALLAEERRSAPLVARHDPSERLRRLARAYADGAYTDEEYARLRAAAQEEPATPTAPAPFDLDTALAALHDIPALWSEATAPERRAMLGHLFTHIYTRRASVYALRPTRIAEPLLRALWESRATSNPSPPADRRPVLLTAA